MPRLKYTTAKMPESLKSVLSKCYDEYVNNTPKKIKDRRCILSIHSADRNHAICVLLLSGHLPLQLILVRIYFMCGFICSWRYVFSISCSFLENLGKSYVGPTHEGRRPYLRGILDPPLMCYCDSTYLSIKATRSI